MARRGKITILEDLIQAPWWVSLVVLIVGNIGIRFIIPAYFNANATNGSSGVILTKGIGGAMPGIADMFTLVMAFALVLSLVRTFIQHRKSGAAASIDSDITTLQQSDLKTTHNSGPSFSRPSDAKHLSVPAAYTDSHKPNKLTQSLLNEIEWKRFESLCSATIYELGLEAKETQYGADGGIDIVVYKHGSEDPVGIVQCKAGDNRIIGLKPVRELLGVMAHGNYKQGMFMTTGSYTQQAIEFAKGRITLVTGDMLIGKINNMQPKKLQMLLDYAFEGDYRTPTCPKCGIKMVQREANKGRGAGNVFWGCANYPKCRQTLTYKQDDD